MGKLQKNESGFSAVEIVLVVVIVALIGVVGYMVYKNHYKSTTTTSATAATPFVNVIQADDSVTQDTPSQIAKTTDEAYILTALHNSCTGGGTYVTVNFAVFDGNSNFKQDGNYAVINAGRCDVMAKTLNDLAGSGSENYLHKNSSGTWVFDTSSQMAYPDCTKVDGLGYPTSIISTCYDGLTSRAPKQ